MKGIWNYIKEAIFELRERVTWPTWEDLQRSALTVLVASMIIALIILVMDQASNAVLGSYYNFFDNNAN